MEQQQRITKISVTNPDTKQITETIACPFCNGENVKPMTKDALSDHLCLTCGAVFYSLQYWDTEKRGLSHDRREPLTEQFRIDYLNNFNKEH